MSLTHYLTISLSHSLTHSLTHSLAQSLTDCVTRDAIFLGKFVALGGFNIMKGALSGREQSLPIVLPLVSICFQIPMKYIPLPYTVDSGSKIAKFLDIEETLGVTDQMLPLVCLLFDIVSVNSRIQGLESGKVCIANDVIISVFMKGFDTCSSFKSLMQTEKMIDTLSEAILNCSDACEEFGAAVMGGAGNLLAGVREDHFGAGSSIEAGSAPGQGLGRSQSSSQSVDAVDQIGFPDSREMHSANADSPVSPFPVSTPVSPFPVSTLHSLQSTETTEADLGSGYSNMSISLSAEGFRLLDFVYRIMSDAAHEFHSPHLLSYFFLSFPQTLSHTFVQSFQILIFEKFHDVIVSLLGSLGTVVPAENLYNVHCAFSHIVPLIRARLLYDEVLFEILKLCIECIREFPEPATSPIPGTPGSGSESRSPVESVVKSYTREMVQSARYFTVTGICSNPVLTQY